MFRPQRGAPPLNRRRRLARAGRAALWLTLGAAMPAAGQERVEVAQLSRDALFKEAFGRAPAAKPRAIPLALELDGKQVGLVNAQLGSGGKAQALPQAAPILKALEPVLQEEAHAALAESVDPQGFLPFSALQAHGLAAAYDPARLVIKVDVPPRLRRTSVHTVASRNAPPPDTEVATSSRVSGFLNARLSQDLLWAHGRGDSPVRQPLKLGLESAINVRGWVLEGRGEVLEGEPTRFTRGDVRLVRDVPEWAVRFVAGDLTTPTAGFQPSRSLLGLSASRQFALDPSRQMLPEEAVTFVLERPSRVDVLVNGRQVRSLQLQAGPQDLRGMLLDLGSNELELVITDDQGTQQRVTKRVGLATGQLAPGVSEFSYSVGFPLQQGSLTLARDWSTPTVHLVHRQGLGHALTLGGSLQADPVTQALGLEQVWGTYWGSVSATGALSHREGLLGYAAGLRYELRRGGKADAGLWTLGLGGEYRDEAFTLAGELPTERPSYLLSTYYSQSFGGGFNARLSLEARAQGAVLTPGYGGTLSLTKSFRNGLALMLDTTARTLTGGERELRGRLNLVWAWPEARRAVTALTDYSTVSGPSGQLTVNQQFDRGSTTVNATAGVMHDATSDRVSESLTYRGQRAEAEISHRMTSPASARGNLESVVQTRVGMALVFADGLFALSRPVTNSFAIVVPNDALRGQWIGVNPTGKGYSAAADGLGPAVLPDLQPYAWSTLRVGAPELPVGYSLGAEAHSLKPTYRNGTVVRVGEEGSVLLRGVLRDASGAPVALSAGTVERLDGDAPEEPVAFFTNRTGRFALGALKPGKYQLKLVDGAQPTRFSIPEGSVGVFDLGRLDTGRPGAEVIAKVVNITRESLPGAPEALAPRSPAAPAAEPALVALPSTVRGRLYGDRNANGTWDADEPTFAGVRVKAGSVTATTDEDGRYVLEKVAGPEAVLAVDTPDELPFGAVPGDKRLSIGAPEVLADLLAPAARFPMAPRGVFDVSLPEGRVNVTQLEKARFPLVSWVAGLPLSDAEAQKLEKLSARVHEDKAFRLLVVAYTQTTGSLRGAVKRASLGGRALQRYLQATQFVPGARLALTVVEPLPGLEDPLGHIDLVLVRVEGADAP